MKSKKGKRNRNKGVKNIFRAKPKFIGLSKEAPLGIMTIGLIVAGFVLDVVKEVSFVLLGYYMCWIFSMIHFTTIKEEKRSQSGRTGK